MDLMKKNQIIISHRCKKMPLRKFKCFDYKSPRENKGEGIIPQYNKGYI